MGEGDTPNREENLPGEPAFRVRKSDAITGLTLAGLIALLTFFWNVTSQLSENLRIEIRNSENRIINRISTNEQLLYKCCGRGR